MSAPTGGYDLLLLGRHRELLGTVGRVTPTTRWRARRRARRNKALFLGVPLRQIKLRPHTDRLPSVLIEPTFEDEARWKRMEDL